MDKPCDATRQWHLAHDAYLSHVISRLTVKQRQHPLHPVTQVVGNSKSLSDCKMSRKKPWRDVKHARESTVKRQECREQHTREAKTIDFVRRVRRFHVCKSHMRIAGHRCVYHTP